MEELNWLCNILYNQNRKKLNIVSVAFVVTTIFVQSLFGYVETFVLMGTYLIIILNRLYMKAINSNNSIILNILYVDKCKLISKISCIMGRYIKKVLLLLLMELVIFDLFLYKNDILTNLFQLIFCIIIGYALSCLLWVHTFIILLRNKSSIRKETFILFSIVFSCEVGTFSNMFFYALCAIFIVAIVLVRCYIKNK